MKIFIYSPQKFVIIAKLKTAAHKMISTIVINIYNKCGARRLQIIFRFFVPDKNLYFDDQTSQTQIITLNMHLSLVS